MTLPIARELAHVRHPRDVASRPASSARRCSAPCRPKCRSRSANRCLFPPRLGKPEEFASMVQTIVENCYPEWRDDPPRRRHPHAAEVTMPQGPAQRDVMEYDVAVVGGGPAGLADGHSSQTAATPSSRICVLEKGSTIGAHIVVRRRDGARPARRAAAGVARQRAAAPSSVPVTRDEFHACSARKGSTRVPWIAEVPAQPRQLHHLAGRARRVDGHAGRSARHRRVRRLRRGPAAVR